MRLLQARLRGDARCEKHDRTLGADEWVCFKCADERADAHERDARREALTSWWRSALPLDELGGLPSWAWARAEHAAWRSACDRRVLSALDAWTPGESLAILAGTGSGKTSGFVARVYTWRAELARDLARPALAFAYTTALDLAEAQKRRKLGESEHPLVRAAMTRPVLVIDEAQLLPATLGMAIADVRYRRGLGTLLLGGVSTAEFGSSAGAAVLRKFTEGGDAIDLCGAGLQ